MKLFPILGLVALLIPSGAYARQHGFNPPPAPAPQPAPGQNPAPSDPTERQAVPSCVDKKGDRIADPNNAQVLQWKTTTPNQYLDRGYIRGTLVGEYPISANGHVHLDVYIGGDTGGATGKDTDLEVIYNQEFGAVSGQLKPGVEVIACGDYITSNKQSGPYPASPLGAILHWVHKAMNGNHPGGFLMIDGHLYGQMDAPPRPGHGNDNGEPTNLFNGLFAY